MTKEPKSSAELLHSHLNTLNNGMRFTYSYLSEIFPDMSGGMVSGFISRALKKGMIKKVGKQENTTVYELVDKSVKWRFAPSSKGSKKGRRIYNTQKEQLPLFGEIIQKNDIINFTQKTLSGQILDLAAMVEKLESRPLADFSTDQLLEEIKRRVK